MLHGNNEENILLATERIRSAFAQSSISVDDETIQATASFGVSFMPANEENLEKVINAADKALYEAKASGRNKVIFSDINGNLAGLTA